MPGIETLLTNLREQEGDYEPNEIVQAGLRQKSLIAIVGPMAVGKSALIQ
ncbi:MAG: hypothetical protein ACREGF_00150 [Candidatus Saccharimonadales bacterium]